MSYVPAINLYGMLSDLGDKFGDWQSKREADELLAKALGGQGGAAPQASAAPAAPFPGGPASTLANLGSGISSGIGSFEKAVNRTLGFEGGLNPRDTNGTPSNFGINQAANPDVDVKSIDKNTAIDLYKRRYWDSIEGDRLAQASPALAHVAFDTAVIAGPGKARELLMQSGGDPSRFLALREQFQNNLVQSNPEKYGEYANAWAKRNADLLSDIGGGQRAVRVADASGAIPRSAIPQQQPQQPAAISAPAATSMRPQFSPELVARMLQNPYTKSIGAVLLQSQLQTKNPEYKQFGDAIYRQGADGSLTPIGMVPKNTESVRTLTTPEERAKFGVPSDYKGAVQVDQTGKLSFPGKAAAEVNIDQRGEQAERQELGKLNAKAIGDMRTSGDQAPMQISKLNMVDRLLDGVNTGALADVQSTIVRYGKAFGIPDETIASVRGLDPKLPQTQQAVSKIINEMTVGMIGPGGFPANNFSDADRKFLSDVFPKLTNEPAANKIAIEVLRRVESRKADKLSAWDNYSEQKGGEGKQPSFEEFDRLYRKQIKGQDLFGDIVAQQPQQKQATELPKLGSVPIPMPAAQALRAKPELRDEFDAKYGAGASDKVLGRKR